MAQELDESGSNALGFLKLSPDRWQVATLLIGHYARPFSPPQTTPQSGEVMASQRLRRPLHHP